MELLPALFLDFIPIAHLGFREHVLFVKHRNLLGNTKWSITVIAYIGHAERPR
jgi:hypothetical protein